VLSRFVLERAAHSVVLFLAASLVVFLLLHIVPGDPAEMMLGERATPEAVAALREALGLDRPLHVQYVSYLGRLFHGDLGLSIRARRPVLEVIAERAAATGKLALAAALIAVAVGIPVGGLAAVRRGAFLETAAFGLSLVGQSMPGYWLGLILINIFAVGLGWLPVSGSASTAHVVLPAVTLSAFMVGLIVRLTRSTMLEVMGEDYIRTARAKGLSEAVVVSRHALRLALIPVITVIGLQIGTLLSGAVVTESIFAWPGIGSLAVLAVFQRDYPVVQGLVLLSALVFLVINFVIDILYALIDPRIATG
jgi:peptide/nickel transport system permease protein